MYQLYQCLILMLLLHISMLQGEIKEITVKWNAFTCFDICIPRLTESLKSITSVYDLKVDSQAGVAVMKWDYASPYSYEPFRLAMANAGVSVINMRMRIQGTISHNGDDFYIDVDGNNTRFLIVGPLQVDPNIYVPRYSLAAHALTNELKAQLLDIENQRQIIMISGPLYLPAQYPQIIIVEEIGKPPKPKS